jgi:hypothetical protein
MPCVDIDCKVEDYYYKNLEYGFDEYVKAFIIDFAEML